MYLYNSGLRLRFEHWVQFYVSVAFVFKQPEYKCTATENEFIVCYGIWCILNKNFSIGLTLPCIHLHIYVLAEVPGVTRGILKKEKTDFWE